MEEAWREDERLIDAALFDVEPYRGVRHVDELARRADEWNQPGIAQPLLFQEYNWTERDGPRWVWRRVYGTPTDGTHRAAAARKLGLATWVTVTRYAFEAPGIRRIGLPLDRADLAPWLVPVGDPPRPRHEVLTLAIHDPRQLVSHSTPTTDGLLGFGDEGGVMRVRLFDADDRTVVLFSAVRRGLGASPYGTTLGQIQAMTAIWRLVIAGSSRHPWDLEWWADARGDGRRWNDPRRFVDVIRSELGYAFVARDRAEPEEAPQRLVQSGRNRA